MAEVASVRWVVQGACGLAKGVVAGTSVRMSSKSTPNTPAPSPQHYWDKAKGAWRRRKQTPQTIDSFTPSAEYLERVERMKVEAAARPPRTGRPPSNEFQTMTMSQAAEEIARVVSGDVIAPSPPPDRYPAAPKNFEESERRLRDLGLDEYLALVVEGHSEREICKRIGTRPAHLARWIESMPEGRTRAREAQHKAARAWLDRGLAAVADAETLTELAKAREIAAICKRYAAICDPSFSDRVQVDQTIKAEDPSTIDQRLRALVGQVATAVLPTPQKDPE